MLLHSVHPSLHPNQALIDIVTTNAYGPNGVINDPPEVFVEPDSPEITRTLLARLAMQDLLNPPNTLIIDHQIHVVTTTDSRTSNPRTSAHDVYQVSSSMGARSTTWAVNLTTDTARVQHVDAKGNKTHGNLRMTEVHATIGYFLRYGHVVEPAPQEEKQSEAAKATIVAPRLPAWRRALGLGAKK